MVKIVLDAGHGLNTPGKRCLKSIDPKETREWVLNSRVAEHIEAYLKEYEGYEVLRVDDRTGKADIALATRTSKANSWGADIYLSIHHNAGINGGSGGGITVYRYPNSTKTSRAMLQSLYNDLIKHTGLKGNRSTPLNDTNFHVLRETNMTAILIEGGFMDSKVDTPIILTDKFAKQYARGVVDFLASQYKLKKKATAPPASSGSGNTNTGSNSNDGYYRVVVGSYKVKANAEKQMAELKKAGFDSFLAYYEK